MSTIRSARSDDIQRIMPLVREFYIYEKLTLDEARYRELATELVARRDLGRLLVIETETELIGYAVVGFGFSLEFGGRDALLDEFYIRETSRGKGTGTELLRFVEQMCRTEGIRAVHLEADHFNVRVHQFYQRMGFCDHKRHLMTKWL